MSCNEEMRGSYSSFIYINSVMFVMSKGNNNRTVLVTGGNRGIGKATALKLAESKYNIIFTYNSGIKEARVAEKEITSLGMSVRSYQVDLSEASQLEEFTSKLRKSGRKLFALINNAGIYDGSRLNKIDNMKWERTIGLNLSAPFYLVRNLHDIIEDNGSVVNISSVYGFRADPWAHGYQASKAAIIHLTRGLAKELAPRVRVNCVAPGYVRTDMNKGGWKDDSFYNKIKGMTPMLRWGEPEDIANAVKFLIDPANSFITGETLVVDGGIGL
ncbi:MAG: SDR family NAD(P)-dependent oxidoreductase [Thermoplasmata archaeon]